MTTEDNEMRFGIIAVEKEFVTADQVVDALEIQVKEDLSSGKHQRIGMILLEQGHITLPQVNEVLQIMGSNIDL
ncbi:hypothetical protein ACFL1N_08080 [Thermodesulfobacteriota bacterium]